MKHKLMRGLALAAVLALLAVGSGRSATWTDQPDYQPGSVVTISGDNRDGAGYLPGETVQVAVSGPNGYTAACQGAADEAGAWSCQVTLWNDPLAMGEYTYTATGQISGVSQSGAFSDNGLARHGCVIMDSGGVKCWGWNQFGQLGDGTKIDRHTPVDVVGLNEKVVQLTTGNRNTCAITEDGGLKCWGANYNGAVGDGTRIDRCTPVDVVGLTTGVAQVSAGLEYACAVTDSGGAKCWGSNAGGPLGTGDVGTRLTPTDVVGLTSGVSQISAFHGTTCALLTTGGVKCWGTNNRGQLGNGTLTPSYVPVDVIGLSSGVAQVEVGLAWMTGGGFKFWGADGSGMPHPIPEDLPFLTSSVIQYSSGFYHACALLAGGGLQCWGCNWYGSLGDGTTTHRWIPVDVVGLGSGVAQVTGDDNLTCALTTEGGVKCWGWNTWAGQVGDGTTTNRLTPVDVVGLSSGVARLPDIYAVFTGDSTPPVITPTVNGTLGENGWYVSDVEVAWSVVDEQSEITEQSGCETTVITSDTSGLTLTCTAASAGGSSSQSVTIQRDATPPALLSAAVTPNPVILNASAAASAAWDASLSGLAAASCDPVLTDGVGIRSVTCRASDLAGNLASASVPYQVIYNFSSFFQPVDNLPVLNLVKAGQAIPVKFSLAGDQGMGILAPGYPGSAMTTCGTTATDAIEETVTAGSSSLQYDPVLDQYTYVWKTEKAWAGTCRTLTVKFIDGMVYQANFKFR